MASCAQTSLTMSLGTWKKKKKMCGCSCLAVWHEASLLLYLYVDLICYFYGKHKEIIGGRLIKMTAVTHTGEHPMYTGGNHKLGAPVAAVGLMTWCNLEKPTKPFCNSLFPDWLFIHFIWSRRLRFLVASVNGGYRVLSWRKFYLFF